MRTWNLDSLEDFDQEFVERHGNARPRRKYGTTKKAVVFFAAALMVSTFSVAVAQVSTTTLSYVAEQRTYARTAYEVPVPLGDFLESRFSKDWTPDKEGALLQKLQEAKEAIRTLDKNELRWGVLDANQTENASSPMLLTKDDIKRIIAGRRLDG